MSVRRPRRAAGASITASLAVLAVAGLSAAASGTEPAEPGGARFDRVATYPVFQNLPAGVDPGEETVAEISAISEDGNTLAYTDSPGGRIGFLDISDPSAPAGLGSLAVDGEPTSVSIVGEHALVVVSDSESYTDPTGRLDVVTLAAPHQKVATIDLGGQPDSIAISPDGAYAAIAIENERDEEFTPAGGEEGDLPQPPAGLVQVVSLTGAPSDWTATPVELPESVLADAGIAAPSDPEPEYVDIDAGNKLALSLQENNGVVVIDLPTGEIESAWNAGEVTLDGVDTDDDGRFDFTGSTTGPREPDALHWIGDGHLATANEGDWRGGTRGWTVFDAATGEAAWDAGNSFERIATRHGLHNEGRMDNKGSEPEGLAFAEYDGTPYVFVGSERSNFVAVYDVTDPASPRFVQALPTAMGPEGLLPIPGRDLFAVSTEEDASEDGIRATVSLYALGEDAPSFPSVVSADADGGPIGWGALSALSTVPGEDGRLWAASDSAFTHGRIYGVDVTRHPAVIDRVLTVTEDGSAPALDVEGLSARAGDGFWLGVEGASGVENELVRTDGDGVVVERVGLPAEVAAGLGKQGIEGVAAVGEGDGEVVYVALQRALAGEERARIGRYRVADGSWDWFGYELDTTEVEGDWIGLSEIVALDHNSVAVIERDKQWGTAAAHKKVYVANLPSRAPAGKVVPVRKHLAVDVLPALGSFNGWTQEKLEGLGVTAGGEVYAVTDNDGIDDANGETDLMHLGSAEEIFGEWLSED